MKLFDKHIKTSTITQEDQTDNYNLYIYTHTHAHSQKIQTESVYLNWTFLMKNVYFSQVTQVKKKIKYYVILLVHILYRIKI